MHEPTSSTSLTVGADGAEATPPEYFAAAVAASPGRPGRGERVTGALFHLLGALLCATGLAIAWTGAEVGVYYPITGAGRLADRLVLVSILTVPAVVGVVLARRWGRAVRSWAAISIGLVLAGAVLAVT